MVPQRLPNLTHSRLVLAVVAEEDVKGLGQGAASWFGMPLVYQELWATRGVSCITTISAGTSADW